MEYRSLGRTGVQVSQICLGTMMFGGRTDGAEAGRIIAHGRENGVNFIDTADVYTAGRSEQSGPGRRRCLRGAASARARATARAGLS